jgi:site-specific DNA recombinase
MLKDGRLPQGTGIGIYGYQWIKEYKKRIPLEREAKIVKRMFEMVAQGDSCFKIARILNEEGVPTKSGSRWEAPTVSRIVRNSAYMGITYFGQTSGRDHEKKPQESWYVLLDVTPAIISKELFERAQTALAKSKEMHPGKAKHEYLLTGFAVCGYCGSPLVGSCLRGDYRYYHCRGTYPTASRQKICDARYIRAEWLEGAVWERVKSVLCYPELLLAEIGEQSEVEDAQISNGRIDEEIKALGRKVKQYAGQERRLIRALKVGFASDMVLDEMKQIKKEKEADRARLASLAETRENMAKVGDYKGKLRDLCARIVPALDNCISQDKKDAYRYLDLRIRATPEGADIKGYLRLGVIDGDSYLLTTGQTWGCLILLRYDQISDKESLSIVPTVSPACKL